ncbi:MAG: hypothetical protein IJA72_01850, partial [Clostridia bacterium]|nr:hypothetical protein [Clostridia bacterium]
GAVAAVVVPIVVYNSVKKEGNYYVQVESNAPNFERYGITLKQGSTIKSLKDKLNIFEGHELVNIYKDEACTIPYADSDKIERNTVVYLEYRKLKYSVNIPDDMSSGYIVSYDKGLIDEDGKIEYGTTLTFKVDAISDNGYEKKDNFAVKVNGNTISADSEGNYIIDISEATEIVVEGVGLKTYSLNNLPKGVTVYSENQNKNLTLEDEIVYGDNLNFSYIVTEGYEKSVFKVNGKDCSGSSYKFVVTNSNMGDSEEITVEYVETRINYAVNIPEEKADDGFTIVLPTEDFDNGHFAVGEDIKVNWGNTFKFNVVVDQGYKIPVVTLTSEVVAGINLIPVATSTQQNKTIYTYQVDSIKQGINIDVSVDKEVYVVYFSDKDGLKNKSVEYGTILSAIAPTVNNYSTDSHNYQFKCWAVYTGETEYEEINASTYKITAQTIFTAIYTETIKTYSYMASTTNCSASFVVERDGENVEISLENPKVQYGDVIKISNIKPNEGYKDDVSINVLGATYNDNKGGWVVDNSHTGVVVSVEAISQENKSVTLVQGDGYKLTFKEGYSASVVYGGECVVLVTPDEGYVLTGFSVDETDKFVQGKTEYTLSEITHDTTISATAELISYTLKVESDTQDSVIVTRTSTDSEDTATTLKNGDTVYYWDELTISYTEPGEGYIKTEFSINGSDVDGVSKNITLNKDWVTNGELVVKYSQQALKYKVELPQGEGYTITYSKDITTLEEFTIEDSFTFEVVAETGYKLSEDGVVITTGAQLTKNSTGNYTISNFTDNVSITVNVQLETYDIEIPMSDYGYYSFNQIIRDAEGNITKKAVDVSKISVQYNKVLELEFVIQEGYTTADGLAPKIMIDNTTEIVKNSDNFYAYTVKNSGVINVVANFVKKAYTIKLDVDAQLTADDYELTFTNSNYSVGATVEHGTTEVTFIFRLTNEKYSGYDVAVDGGEYRKVIDGVYTISNVVGDASGNLVIKILNPVIKTYQITESDTNIESLVFEGTEKVVYGENATFTIKLSDAYNKYQLTEDNLTIVGNYSSFSIINNVCTIVNVTSDITISVKDIVKNTYT